MTFSLHQNEAGIRLVLTRSALSLFGKNCDGLTYKRLARDTPTHAPCASSPPHPSSLSPLISGTAEEVFQQTTPAALCFDSGCTSGLFPVAAWTQDASRRGGAWRIKKKRKEKKSRSPDDRVLLHCAGVLSNSGRNLPQMYKKEDRLKNINPLVNPGALFSTGRSQALLFLITMDTKGH